ncbi:hypothetical protein D9E96_26390, partial [Escherichia coli]|nr:hypothetical protein [Escherichia coli]
METCSICAVTSQVDAAIGRSQGISAVQLQTRTICAVTCQADAAVGRGDIAPLNADTVPIRLCCTVEADIA